MLTKLKRLPSSHDECTYLAAAALYLLCFAAGAMIFVVVEELIPEAKNSSSADLATLGAMAGFIVMMILDVALG